MFAVLHSKVLVEFNEEGKTCAQLVELTIKVFHMTRKVFQVMPNNFVIHQLEPTPQANK